jgi:hypothetical protein
LGITGTVATRASHAPLPLAAWEPTRHRNEAKKKKGSNRSHPFLPSYVGGGDQRHLQNQEKSTKQSFYFSFFFL